MKTLYHFHDALMLRCPQHSFSSNIDEDILLDKIKDHRFLESIYLASPNLYDACTKLTDNKVDKEKKKAYLAIAKYLARMSSRCTPFGLFAGISIVRWGQNTNIVTSPTLKRQTRLDMHFLCALAQKLAFSEPIRYQLKYFINSSAYVSSNEVRYIEYSYQNGVRTHQISSIGYSEYIEKVISHTQKGLSFHELVLALTNYEINKEDAANFINQLIDAQFLVSELEPAITGNAFDKQLLEVLEKMSHLPDANFSVNALKSIQNQLHFIDDNIINPIEKYRAVVETVKTLGIAFEENRLFQTDMNIQTQIGATIDQRWQEDIYTAINCLLGLHKKKVNKNLLSFAERFYARYEHKEVPLPIALDTEMGIGYLDNHIGDFTPLVEGLEILDNNKNKKNTLIQLEEAQEQNLYEITLQEADFDLQHNLWEKLPPSFSVMFRMLNHNQILLESVGGSSASNILGRFAHLDTTTEKLINEIVAEEEYHNEDVIFAEIIHLPESRTGNILLHPVFRKYEIPYLGKSSLDVAHQIPLNDLYISVKNNNIYLRSKKFNKIVIPRLSNAHNYTYNALPVYQFLCDLQNQGQITGIGFDWGEKATQYKFLPRVRIKNVIVHLATWVLSKTDFNSLLTANNSVSFISFCEKYKLPRHFVIADNDNELLIDTQNPILVQIFLNSLKNRSSIILKEFIVNEATGIQNTNNQIIANQLIASMIRQKPCFDGIQVVQNISHIQRSFSMGSEWLYFKIYCGAKNADKILTEAIEPLVTQAYQNGLVKKWFFIRYNDPHFHIRLRFNLIDSSRNGELINLFYSFISNMEEQEIVWKVQADTYQRELERYGSCSIELVESLFCIDSSYVLNFLSEIHGDEREYVRWIYAIKAIDNILDTFEYTLEQKRDLLQNLKESFAKEFGMNQHLKLQIDVRYRENRAAIESFANQYPSLIAILESNKDSLCSIAKEIIALEKASKLEVSINSLLASLIHMQVNRIVTSNPRLHELLIYDFAYRQYQSIWARNKQTVKM